MSSDKLDLLIQSLPLSIRGFLNYLKTENKSRNTIINYGLDLRGWVEHEFKNNKSIAAKDFEMVQLEDLYIYIGKVSDTKSSASVARLVGAIKSFYRYMIKFNKITINPSQNLGTPKVERKVPKYLTESDMIKLLKSIKLDKRKNSSRDRDYAMMLTFLTAGLRLSELIGIKVSDINEDGSLVVKGKGNKEREIPLADSCFQAIQDYLKVRVADNKTLFVNRKGQPFTPNGVQKIVKKYLEMIGREDLSVHKLRHSCLSNMLQNGADLRTLQEIAGHSSLTTTQIYTHINSDNKRKAVNNTKIAELV